MDHSTKPKLALVSGSKPAPGEAGLSRADFPLGPFAGATIDAVQVAGGKLHLDAACSSLKRTPDRFTHVSFPQTGSIADLEILADAHCAPGGELGLYLAEVDHLIRKATLVAEVRDIDGAVKAVERLREEAELEAMRLREPREERLARRWQDELAPVRDHLQTEFAELLAERISSLRRWDGLSIAAVAQWIAGGRTPRQHQTQYEAILVLGSDVLKRLDRTDWFGHARDWLHHRNLPERWLEAVRDHGVCERMMAKILPDVLREERAIALHHLGENEAAVQDYLVDTERILLGLGEVWSAYVMGAAQSNDSKMLVAVASFARFPGDLADVMLEASQSVTSSPDAGEITIAIVPRAFLLLFGEDRRRDVVVLDADVGFRFVSEDRLRLVLNNLLGSVRRAAKQKTAAYQADDNAPWDWLRRLPKVELANAVQAARF
jgi:hypothetical protein